MAIYAEGETFESISKALPGRPVYVCKSRWQITVSKKHPEMPKKRNKLSEKWSAEEDRRLFKSVQRRQELEVRVERDSWSFRRSVQSALARYKAQIPRNSEKEE